MSKQIFASMLLLLLLVMETRAIVSEFDVPLEDVVSKCAPAPGPTVNLTDIPCQVLEGGTVLSCTEPDSIANIPQLGKEDAEKITEILVRNQPRFKRIKVNDLKRYENLEKLFIDYSGLETLESECLRCLGRLKHLSLMNNRLKLLPWQSFVSSSPTIQAIDIAGNPVECGCHLLWLQKWTNLTEPKCIRLEEAACEFAISVADLYHLPKRIIGYDGLTCLANRSSDGKKQSEGAVEEFVIKDYPQDPSCKPTTAKLTPVALPAIPWYRCEIGNIPAYAENYSVEVQAKTEAAMKLETKMSLTRSSVNTWLISVDNVTYLDNGWLVCRYNYGPIPAVAIIPFLVRSIPVIERMRIGYPEFGTSCTFEISSFPPAELSWKFENDTLNTEKLYADHYIYELHQRPPTEFYRASGTLSVNFKNIKLLGTYILRACNKLGCSEEVCEIQNLRSGGPLGGAYIDESGDGEGLLPDACRIPLLIAGSLFLALLIAAGVAIGVLINMHVLTTPTTPSTGDETLPLTK